MGRRSTPFFHDFFHRGAKLGNASNRYEYTCRRCGRVLKNRAESLVAHLVGARGCPHVAPDEAARVAVFINERNRRKERKRAQRGSVRPSAAAEAETAVPRRGDAEAAEPLNGLAALAEAGRQLEGPGRNEGADVNGAHAHAREPESPSGTSDDCSSLFENSVDGDSEANGDRPTDGTSPAGEGLATAQTQVPKAGSSRKMASRTKSRAQAPEQSNGATLSPLQSPNKKVRGPFSPTRKKEIHEVRKMGACLRCRMLRKTCSGGDPCASCEKLRNKRLWRTPCMRIRLAQAFDLYAIRVFEQMWLRDSKDLASKQKLADQGGRLLLRHPKREDLYVYFGALLGQHQASEESHAGNGVPGPTRRPEPLLMPLEDQYQVAEKLDEYLGRLAKSPDDSDPSPLLQLTIGQATDMAVGMSDTLIPQAILIWTITQILSSDSPFHLYYCPPASSPSASTPERTRLPFPSSGPAHGSAPPPHTLLTTYLLSHLERRAALLCHALLTDLERCLLRSHRRRGFDFFPVAVLLLTAVERMEWLVLTFADGDKAERWPLADSPEHYAVKARAFAAFLCDLLRQRRIAPRCAPDPARAGILMPLEPDDELATQWFEAAKLREEELLVRRDAHFEASDPKSMELKYTALLLLPHRAHGASEPAGMEAAPL